MAKFELSISDSYVKDWSIAEGVRELIQNAKDAEQDGHPMTVFYSKGLLGIRSDGARLDRSVLLLGVTSKADGNYRGHFGEGLKLGALALTRAQRSLSIVNDDESWHFSLEDSDTFGVPVLTVRTRKLPEPTGSFTVHVSITPDEWEETQRNFRFLHTEGETIDSDTTHILLDPAQIGRCYVKGIYVETKENMTAGYDFLCASTDRDRRMVGGFDFAYYSSTAWTKALSNGAISPGRFIELLNADSPDTRDIPERRLDEDFVILVRDEFRRRHGLMAIPVTCNAEVLEAGHLGRVGIIGSKKVVTFFGSHDVTRSMTLDVLKSENRTNVVAIHDPSEFTANEMFVFTYVNGLVDAAARARGFCAPLQRLQIVDFSSPEVLGLSTPPTDDPDQPLALLRERRLWIARSQLSDASNYLRVLVHELAHDRGGDGAVGHRDAENELYTAIILRASGIDWSPRVSTN